MITKKLENIADSRINVNFYYDIFIKNISSIFCTIYRYVQNLFILVEKWMSDIFNVYNFSEINSEESSELIPENNLELIPETNLELLPENNLESSPKSSFVRCTHNNDFDENFNDLLVAHNFSLENLENNERIMLGSSKNPIDLGTGKILIDIPIIFHLLDPKLSSHDINFWSKHINETIIAQLNNDYNVSYINYSCQYILNVNTLFEKADPSKKNFYLNLASSLPKNANLQWKFSLRKVIIEPQSDLQLSSGENIGIFRSASVEDPENFLNIIIIPGAQILGVSVFPFSDRDINDSAKINPTLRYKNAVLINTTMFEGKTPPFDKYRTFTHEIGHWCGLLHPFDNVTYKTPDMTKFGLNKLDFDKSEVPDNEQDQDFVGDLIADTPPQTQPTYGTVYDKVIKKLNKTFKRETPYAYIFEKNNQTPNFYNFMDYTDDAQMCLFTQYQILHMVYMLSRFRPNFVKQN